MDTTEYSLEPHTGLVNCLSLRFSGHSMLVGHTGRTSTDSPLDISIMVLCISGSLIALLMAVITSVLFSSAPATRIIAEWPRNREALIWLKVLDNAVFQLSQVLLTDWNFQWKRVGWIKERVHVHVSHRYNGKIQQSKVLPNFMHIHTKAWTGAWKSKSRNKCVRTNVYIRSHTCALHIHTHTSMHTCKHTHFAHIELLFPSEKQVVARTGGGKHCDTLPYALTELLREGVADCHHLGFVSGQPCNGFVWPHNLFCQDLRSQSGKLAPSRRKGVDKP